jgi:predicted RNA binding protein YcfA (HicA-like mRNA interferase family)
VKLHQQMSKFEKIILKLTDGKNDWDFRFDELCSILETYGFENRIKGSHHIYFKTGIPEIINLQLIGKKAKPYQVKQVRNILLRYKLIVSNE